MGRKKQTPEQLAQAEKERVENNLLHNLEWLRRQSYPKDKPVYTFGVGDRVRFGAHTNTVVIEVLDDGLIYRIHSEGHRSEYGRQVWYEQDDYKYWFDVHPWRESHDDFMSPAIRNRVSYANYSVGSLIHRAHHFGVNMDPDYQRGYVWDLDDKVNLIDSIFNEVEIGKFLFNVLPINNDTIKLGYLYEIVDGKQRLRALLDYYENKFSYRDKYFYQLNPRDQDYITNYPVSVAEVKDYSRAQILGLFLKVNTTGRVMSQEHLNKVRDMYDAM